MLASLPSRPASPIPIFDLLVSRLDSGWGASQVATVGSVTEGFRTTSLIKGFGESQNGVSGSIHFFALRQFFRRMGRS